MSMRGGQTTFSGTKYQAEITAINLVRLLDPSPRGDRDTVVFVRPECDVDAAVDDILVCFKDEHTEWFQVKENITDSGETWKKMWRHFEDQLALVKPANNDRIALVFGKLQPWSNNLKALCQRAYHPVRFC